MNTRSGRIRIGLMAALVFAIAPIHTGPQAEAAAATSGKLVPVMPCRLFDSRRPVDGADRLLAEATEAVDISGRCGVPSSAFAAALTVTVTKPVSRGYLTAWATGSERPATSTLNWSQAGETRANSAIVPVGDSGAVNLYTQTSAHVVVDVSGYFVAEPVARDGRFVVVGPSRLVDTREAGGELAFNGLAPAGVQRVPLPSGVPSDATAVFVNLTTTATPGRGHLVAYPAGTPKPPSSVLNVDGTEQTRAAGAIVPTNSDGFDVYSSSGGHLIVDISGYFTGPSAAESSDGLFQMVNPIRLMDTRTDGRAQLWADGSQALDTALTTGEVAAVVTNLTMTALASRGFLTAFPSETAKPSISSLNVDAPDQTVANLAFVASGRAGLYLYSSASVQLIVDVAGWFSGAAVPPSSSPHELSNVKPPDPPPPGPDCSLYPSGRTRQLLTASFNVFGCARTVRR